MLNPKTSFSPLRLTAYLRNDVELEMTVQNDGNEPRWIECDITVPDAVSLAPDKSLSKGRLRVGIALAGKKVSKKVKIYGGAGSYPDTYLIRLTYFGFATDGTVSDRQEAKAELRCEKTGIW